MSGFRRFLVAALAALALLLAPGVASSAGRIVVYGAASGSHMTLTANGSTIVVSGAMAHAQPQGCRLASPHRAVCSAQGAEAIEVDMGPSGDFVEVLDRMPLRVVAHLGAGEDKLIGNDERDFCYPEGTRRNRCIGEGGDDVCITGSRNSDCVGGGGDDYCRASSGSDGCWGGPGDDVCYMGSGEDGCHGEDGNDLLFGEHSPDQLYGGKGFDYCDGGAGIGRSHQCEAGPRH